MPSISSPSTIHIDAARLRANFRAVQATAQAEVIAVIKADAYGHGAELCAPVLREAGARWLGVTGVEEGARVRHALGEAETHILSMCGMLPEDADAMVAHALTPVLWTVAQVQGMEAAAHSAGKRAGVVLEVDAGMARQGVAPEDVATIAAQIAAAQSLECVGIMAHLPSAERAGDATTLRAQEVFAKALAEAHEAGLRPAFVHLANTSAVDEGSTSAWVAAQAALYGAQPAVRTGLALYGYALPVEGAGAHLHDALAPVMTWTARVVDVRDVAAGATVGYGATFTAPHAMRLALLPVGYADGFRREASSGLGNGWVCFLNAERAPVIGRVVGRVSMNLIVVDVTSIAGVGVGDQAVLLGPGVSAEDHARWAGTIAYDILCGVRGRRVLS